MINLCVDNTHYQLIRFTHYQLIRFTHYQLIRFTHYQLIRRVTAITNDSVSSKVS